LQFRQQFSFSDDKETRTWNLLEDVRNRANQKLLPFVFCHMGNVNDHRLSGSQVKLRNQVITRRSGKSIQVDSTIYNKYTIGCNAVFYHHRFNFLRNRNIVIGQKSIFDAVEWQEPVPKNRKIHPAGDKADHTGTD